MHLNATIHNYLKNWFLPDAMTVGLDAVVLVHEMTRNRMTPFATVRWIRAAKAFRLVRIVSFLRAGRQ